MNENILRADLSGRKSAQLPPVYQFSRGMILEITDPDLPESYRVEYANAAAGKALGQIAAGGRAAIPSQFFAPGSTIYCWITLIGEDYAVPVKSMLIPVSPKAEYIEAEPAPEEQTLIESAIAALNEAMDRTDEALEAMDRAVSSTQAAQRAAEAAKTAAEAAQQDAEAAKTSAETAQAASETAKTGAETAQAASEAAKTSAETAQGKAESAQTAAEAAQAAAGTAAQAAQAASTDAAAAMSNAVNAAALASDAKTDAAAAAATAETAAASAENAKTAAIDAKDTAVASAAAAQTAQAAAETAKTGAQAAQTASETAKTGAETAQSAAEAAAAIAVANQRELSSILPVDHASGAPAHFPDGAAMPVKKLTVDIPVTQSGAGDPSPANIRPICGFTAAEIVVSDDATNDANDHTYDIAFPAGAGTVYCGSLELYEDGTGKLTVTHNAIVIDGVNYKVGELSQVSQESSYVHVRGKYYGQLTNANGSRIPSQKGDAILACSHYKTGYFIGSTASDLYPDTIYKNQNSTTSPINIVFDSISTQEAANAYFAEQAAGEHPIVLVYAPSNPVVYNLTAEQAGIIRTLYGENYISSNCGIVSVDYYAHPQLYVQKLLDALEDRTIQVSGSTPVINALPGFRYICDECVTLDVVLPTSGVVDVVFTSGSTPAILTVTPPTGVTVSWPAWFVPTALEANAVYEINILDGLGVVGVWM